MKRILVTLLCLALLLSVLPVVSIPHAQAAEQVPAGYIPISTPEELFLIRNNLAGKYILTNDIDLTEALGKDGSLYNAAGWIALGYDSTTPSEFTGILDGNGHKIYGLKCVGVGSALVWYNSGTIQNLTIASGQIKRTHMDPNEPLLAAGICATNNGTIYNCQNYADITLTLYRGTSDNRVKCGGVAASATEKSNIILCRNGGTLSVDAYICAYVGGVVGAGGGNLTTVWNTGDVTSISQNRVSSTEGALAGGIIGKAR